MKYGIITNAELVEYLDLIGPLLAGFLLGAKVNGKRLSPRDINTLGSLNHFLETTRMYLERAIPGESTPIKRFKEKCEAIFAKMDAVAEGLDEGTLDVPGYHKNKFLEYTDELNEALHVYCEDQKENK